VIPQPTVGYPTFAAFQQTAKAICKEHDGLIDLREVLRAMKAFLKDGHFNRLVNDLGHGLNHALSVVSLALELVRNEKRPIGRDLIACGSLLHDVYEVVDRENHEGKGSGVAWAVVRSAAGSFPNIDPLMVAEIVASHNLAPDEMKNAGVCVEAQVVRDADTLEEGLNLDRIVWVSAQKGRAFYNDTFCDVDQRLAVLCSEDRAVTEAERCDALMFLLRNVTKSIDPAWFVTDYAKNYLNRRNVAKQNIHRLRELVEHHVWPDKKVKEAMHLVNSVRQAWKDLHRGERHGDADRR
jgi:HD superfamily phosphodiesterase